MKVGPAFPLFLLVLVACGGSSDPRKEPAGAAGARRDEPAAPQLLQAAPFQRSLVTLVGRGPGLTTASTFERLRSTLALLGTRPESLELSVELASLVGSSKAALAVLRAVPGFAESPRAGFRSRSITAGPSPGSYLAAGQLDLLDRSQAVTLPFRLTVEAGELLLEAQVELSPGQWRARFGGRHQALFQDRLELLVRLRYPSAPGGAAAAAPAGGAGGGD